MLVQPSRVTWMRNKNMLFVTVLVIFFTVARAHLESLDPRPLELYGQHLNTHPLKQSPRFRFGTTGIVVTMPESIRVYYDAKSMDPSTLSVNINVEHAVMKESSCGFKKVVALSHVEYSLNACRSRIRARKTIFTLCATIMNGADILSINDTITFVRITKAPWPLENERGVWPPTAPNTIGNIFENYQSFSGVESAYWHQGLDIRSELEPASMLVMQDNPVSTQGRYAGVVHSPVEGKVVQMVNYGGSAMYWSVMVQDPVTAFVWQFHHIDPQTFRVRLNESIAAGTVLGNVIFWPASHNGRNYHHVHMNVALAHQIWCDEDGLLTRSPMPYTDGWSYYNPLDFLDHGKYRQTLKPTSEGSFFFFQHLSSRAYAAKTRRNNATIRVTDTVDVVLNFESNFLPSNNVSGYPYSHGVHRLDYKVMPVTTLNASDVGYMRIEPRSLIHMDRMGPDWFACVPDFTVSCSAQFLPSIFRKRFSYNGRRYESGFDYTRRKMYYSLTNAEVDGYPAAYETRGGWNTLELMPDGRKRFPNGQYILSATGYDWFGNSAEEKVTISIENQ